MTQDRYLGRRLTDWQTADALERLLDDQQCPELSFHLETRALRDGHREISAGPPTGTRTGAVRRPW